MLGFFLKLARHVHKTGDSISFEWPRYCAGWDAIDRVGVESIATGNPILKPWKFYCSDPVLAETLGKYRCDGPHEHTICQGRDPRKLENPM